MLGLSAKMFKNRLSPFCYLESQQSQVRGVCRPSRYMRSVKSVCEILKIGYMYGFGKDMEDTSRA